MVPLEEVKLVQYYVSICFPEGTVGYPAQPGLIRPSVCPSVHACRLGIQRKIEQALQIWSIILKIMNPCEL
jgi:hypothetical protein